MPRTLMKRNYTSATVAVEIRFVRLLESERGALRFQGALRRAFVV